MSEVTRYEPVTQAAGALRRAGMAPGGTLRHPRGHCGTPPRQAGIDDLLATPFTPAR